MLLLFAEVVDDDVTILSPEALTFMGIYIFIPDFFLLLSVMLPVAEHEERQLLPHYDTNNSIM